MRQSDATGATERAGGASNATETRRGVVKWLRREILGTVFVAFTLFIPAGRLDWAMGWALVGLYALWTAATALILIPRTPGLLAERAERRAGAKRWDMALLGMAGLITMGKHIVAGLDVRFGWAAYQAPALQLIALLVAAAGYALTTWAMVANAFFSMVVRIQADRDHAVATQGPYRYVRHPGYVGTIVFELATPIMLGSPWALIPGLLGALLLILRTALEDRTLQNELGGYREYAQRVRYRLLPGMW